MGIAVYVSVPLRGKYRSESSNKLTKEIIESAVSVPLRGKYRSE